MTGPNADRRVAAEIAGDLVANWRRVFVDLFVLTAWVLALAGLFLSTGWPRWAFYTALLLGVVGYTRSTRILRD